MLQILKKPKKQKPTQNPQLCRSERGMDSVSFEVFKLSLDVFLAQSLELTSDNVQELMGEITVCVRQNARLDGHNRRF